jgi:Fe-Mn family superoxide dismutase
VEPISRNPDGTGEEHIMAFELPPLPYAKDALAPHLSAETLDFHHGKHHKAYVDKLNALTQGTPQAEQSLETLVKTAEGGVFNNAAQVWNHTFYWHGLTAGGGGTPKGALLAAIERDFGSFAKFREEFAAKGVALFGSGWLWLVTDGQKLALWPGGNADNPLRHGLVPLLTMDVWEHAYYIDYRNARAGYIERFLDHLVDWDFVAAQLAEAK